MRPFYAWINLLALALSLMSTCGFGDEGDQDRVKEIVTEAVRNMSKGAANFADGRGPATYLSAYLYEWAKNKNSNLAKEFYEKMAEVEKDAWLKPDEVERNRRILTKAMMEIHAGRSEDWPLWACAVAVVGVVNVALAAAIWAR